MCSIFTVFTNKTLCKHFLQFVPNLLEMSKARGPDESGLVNFNEKVLMGSNRLRIIGEPEIGKMPLKSLNRDCWVVFNGEIYNFKELRAELEIEGYKFFSHTDTEVLLSCYLHWGESFVEKLNGIFAFAIYDLNKNKIVSARDRFGCKPLYYIEQDEYVALSSEFNVLDCLVTKRAGEIDNQALTALLKCRFVPGEKTIYKDIKKILPGELVVWDLNYLKGNRRIFWKPKVSPQRFDQQHFEEMLSNAINFTSHADVSPSILLSGGLDSSAIAATLGKKDASSFETFSCYFKGASKGLCFSNESILTTGNLDETDLAKEVALKYSLPYKDFELDYDFDIDEFNQLTAALGEPIAVTNALGLFMFGKKLKGQTKLSLSGTGSDELLGGYQNLYFKEGFSSFANRTPNDFLKGLSDFDGGQIDPLDFLDMSLRDQSYLDNYAQMCLQQFNDKKLENELLNQITVFEMNFALPYWEMDMADRLFMASSIELRPSFLENKFVDYCLTIPSVNKVNKGPLRNMFKNSLPLSIVDGIKIPSLSTPPIIKEKAWFKEIESRLVSTPSEVWNKSMFNKAKKIREIASFDVYYRIVFLQNWFDTRNVKRINVV